MSKVAKQKALKAYPEEKHITYGMIPGGTPFEIDINTRERNGYIKGYDQAIQDFMEKACEWLEPTFKNIAGYNCGGDLMNDFENYMKDDLR